ncbi:MAG: carbohydrate ABC transporter permease [Candidatus Limnocylindrales bacterium]
MAGSVERPRYRRGLGQTVAGSIGRTVAYLVLVVLAVAIIYPLVWMALNGFKSNAELFGDPWGLPTTWRWANFGKAWDLGVVRYLVNSVIVTVAATVSTVLVSSMAAYALTRLRIPFAPAITLILLGGMMLAPTVALIPLFRLIRALGIFDTYWALIILYTSFRISFTVFLIRAYMATLSREIEDAAIVDGANRWQIFWLVVMPLSRPIIVSAALLQALFAWNEFAFALVFINSTSLKTLPVGLLAMQGRVLSDWPVLFAALTMASIPMIVVFLLGQRQFIRGLAEGYGKG